MQLRPIIFLSGINIVCHAPSRKDGFLSQLLGRIWNWFGTLAGRARI